MAAFGSAFNFLALNLVLLLVSVPVSRSRLPSMPRQPPSTSGAAVAKTG